MKITLYREPGFLPTAWTRHQGDVHVRRWRLELPLALVVVAHEVEHLLDPSFTDLSEHPWWHFCGRTDKVSLTAAHLSPRSLEIAAKLLRDGEAEA